ncbi:MAG: secretion protein [Flavobacteriaceae bacterium]|nr:secretion protein [Flavobacteriaceae bacterium]
MRNITLSILFIITGIINGISQDTFSIVAMDPITGEVGSAGASCVDLDANNLPTDDFLGELFPGLGAINSQAYYIPANQANARARMNEGYTPNEIIEWLINNDVQNQPQFRQYGIVGKVGENIETAAYTGVATDDYKNDITGPNYSIQGNILLGEEVLNGMEAGFLNTEGDLACKLMGALQGANIVGADFRCTNNGTSSLFAFVKVAQPSDTFGNPSFLLSVRTGSTDQIEPITELQILFDENRDCESLSLIDFDNDFPFSVYPNPSNDFVSLRALNDSETYKLTIISITGAVVYTSDFISNTGIDVSGISKGIYFINITNKIASYTSKWIKN